MAATPDHSSHSSPTTGAAATPSIGFVGLGTTGRPMCLRLVEAGHRVVVYDIDAASLSEVAERGAEAAASARLCAECADVLFTSLPMPRHVAEVMAGDAGALGALRPGSAWVDLTTNSPEMLCELAAAAPAGVSVVDSPVAGAVDGAHRGKPRSPPEAGYTKWCRTSRVVVAAAAISSCVASLCTISSSAAT